MDEDKSLLEIIADTMEPFWSGVASMGIAVDEAAEQVNDFIKALGDLDISRK